MAQYCTYQDGVQFFYLKKIFCQRLKKTWYYSKKTCWQHENIPNREKTWKNMKHMPSYIYMPGVCFAFLQNCK